MKRTTPMKRSGFKAKHPAKAPKPEREPPSAIVAHRTPIAAVIRMVHGPIRTAPKFVYVRSPSILAACRTLPCNGCGATTRGAVAAHSNWAIHGKGRGIKASDVFVASLCPECHHEIDQGHQLSEAGRQYVWWEAHVQTVKQLCARKLWPADVPVPDILNYPFPLGTPAADF